MPAPRPIRQRQRTNNHLIRVDEDGERRSAQTMRLEVSSGMDSDGSRTESPRQLCAQHFEGRRTNNEDVQRRTCNAEGFAR